jgi:ATP-dependent helicase/nuclease subunit A
MELSAEQIAAVERSGQDVCVVAGPGSGKTRVLVERFAWLVEWRSADPERILAITFTEKAATMMKRKLVERFAHRQDLRERVERAWVATIDAFCARLLRENAIEAGLAPDFSVLDEGSAKRMQRDAAEQALDELFQERPREMRRLLEGLALSTSDDARQTDLAASLLDVHDSMRLAGVRELPAAAEAGDDVLPEARRLAAEVEGEAAWSNLHDWAREFLALTGGADPRLHSYTARGGPPGPPVRSRSAADDVGANAGNRAVSGPPVPSPPRADEGAGRGPGALTRQHFEVLARFKANLGGKKKGREAVKQLKEVVLPRLAEQWILAWHSGLPELVREAVARLDREYREAKRREAAVDFADLEELAIELLESHPELRERIVNQFDHVLMDELQDTNRLQWKLIGLVRRRNFFAVGDINQSIYGFRHADRTVFEGYRAELRQQGLKIDELKENYRSRPEILAAVGHVLEGCEGVEPRELIAKREAAPKGGPVVERLVGTGERAPEAEAQSVTARIAEWAQEGRKWGDFAILVRALRSAEQFERELEARGIPFLVSGGRTFLEARETLDLMALLAAMVNPLDEAATAGVLRGPLAGWSDEQLLQAGAEGRRQEFEKLFGRARRLAGFIAPDRLLAMALDECGYAAGLNDRGRANVDKFLNWIRREFRARPRPLAELLEDLEAMRSARAEAEAPAQQAADAVNIMTIHAAKGLEFPVVFVSALHAGRNSSTPVLLFSAELGLGAKWRNPATGENQKDAAHRALSERLKHDENAEEDRLLYVAMTRAEDRLVLSYARGQRRSPWQKLAEAGIRAETEADRSTEIHAAPRNRLEEANTEVLLEAAAVTGQHDSSAAVTDVVQFAACPRKYYLGRYLGLTTAPRGPGTGALAGRRPAPQAIELGLEVHKALAARGESRSGPATAGRRPAPPSGEALELARRFEESELGQRAARAERVEREFDFLLAVEDVVLRGQIDLWFEEGGELTVVDYKTDRDETGAAEHALQLRLYALALERYAGRLPDRAALCFLRSGNVIEVSLSGADLEDARAAVRALAAAQNALKFPMKAGEQCRRCPFYKGFCPARLEA